MKQLTGNQVRKMFLDFFESKGHKVEPSHSLIPNDDPTLLWINAGVAAIKKCFDGTITPFVLMILKTLEKQLVIIHFLKC